MEDKQKKSKLAVIVFVIFFVMMISYIIITPFIVANKVEEKSKLPLKERIK